MTDTEHNHPGKAAAWMYTKDGELPDILADQPDELDRRFMRNNGWTETPLYATAAPSDQSKLQHVAYFDEGQFHWMSGIAPRDCELYAKLPTSPRQIGEQS